MRLVFTVYYPRCAVVGRHRVAILRAPYTRRQLFLFFVVGAGSASTVLPRRTAARARDFVLHLIRGRSCAKETCWNAATLRNIYTLLSAGYSCLKVQNVTPTIYRRKAIRSHELIAFRRAWTARPVLTRRPSVIESRKLALEAQHSLVIECCNRRLLRSVRSTPSAVLRVGATHGPSAAIHTRRELACTVLSTCTQITHNRLLFWSHFVLI